jgi:hypothetical protein
MLLTHRLASKPFGRFGSYETPAMLDAYDFSSTRVLADLIEGKVFESLPTRADTYLFRHIIHDWSDEQSVLILKNCRKVIRDDGRLLIIEAVVPTGNEPSLAKDLIWLCWYFPVALNALKRSTVFF